MPGAAVQVLLVAACRQRLTASPADGPGCWAAVRRESCSRCYPCTGRTTPKSGSGAAQESTNHEGELKACRATPGSRAAPYSPSQVAPGPWVPDCVAVRCPSGRASPCPVALAIQPARSAGLVCVGAHSQFVRIYFQYNKPLTKRARDGRRTRLGTAWKRMLHGGHRGNGTCMGSSGSLSSREERSSGDTAH